MLEDSVTFLGKRPNTEMPPFLSSGDVALVPSFYEETSIAALDGHGLRKLRSPPRA